MSPTSWIGTIGAGSVVVLFVVMVLRVLKGGTYSTAYASIIALIAITSIGGMLAVADADQLISSGSRR